MYQVVSVSFLVSAIVLYGTFLCRVVQIITEIVMKTFLQLATFGTSYS